MLEPDIGVVFGGKLKFDQLFLQINANKKYIRRVTLKEHSQFDWKW